MTDIPAINSTAAAGNPAAPKAGTQMGKDQFLKLFVAQLQHQDPMNPMQDSDFMGQMASFSTLEQVTNLASENAKSNALGLLGRTVTYRDKDGAERSGVVEKYSTVDGKPSLTVGGTVGVAVFLSIVYSIVVGKISDAFGSAQHTAAFQKAAQAHPDQLKQLTHANTGALNDTSFLAKLDPALAHPFKVGFTNAISVAFLVGAVVLVVAFVLSLMIKEVPLRTTAAAFSKDEESKPAATA